MAEVTVDKLRVEVKATAEGANKVFTQLAKQLETLKSASSFNTSGLTNLTNALNKVSTSLDTLSSKINTVNGKSVTPKINTDGVTSSQKKIDNSISKIRESLAGLTAYGNAAMSGDSSALTSFDRRVTSIQSSIDVLKSRLESLGDTTVKVNAIDYYESKIEKAKDAIDQLVAKENEFKANGTDTGEAWDTLQAKLAEARDQLDALIQEQSKFSAGDMIDVDAFEDQKAALADFQSQLDSASDTVHNTVASMNGQNVDIPTKESQINLAALSSALNTVSAKLLSVVGSSITTGFSKLSSSIRAVKNSVSSLKSKVSGLSSVFNKGFFTVLKYGLGIRSLYVLFRRLRQAVKDSFTELQNSGAYYETTRANVEALKNSLSILKYQFGAAFETIFNTVAPALQTFINYLISAMNTLSAFIAKLTGKSTYSKAVKATSDIAGNAGSAADSAKEMAKQLQGFDELNNLSGNSSGGSSGDSSGVTYVTESVDNALGSFTQALTDSINKGEWEKVGNLISEKLTNMMEKIPWNTIYSKASNFGKNLASFLNGLITNDLFSALGTTIGNAIKTALTFLDSFGTTFNWKNFGDSIASGINSFVKTNPLSLAVDTFNTWANGILDTLNSAISGISWSTIGDHIAEAIGKIDSWSIGWKLGTLVTNFVNAIYDLVKNKNTWKNLGTKIADGINGFFEGFNGSDLAKAANAIANGLWTALGTAIKKIKWYEIADDIISSIGNLDIGTISLIAAVAFAPAALAAIKTGIVTILTTEVAAMGGVSVGTIAVAAIASLAIGWKIGNKIYESATGTEVQGGMVDQLKEVFTGLFGKDKIKFDLGDFISFTFGESNPWNDYFSTLGDEAFYLTTEIKNKFKQIGTDIVDGIKEGFKSAMDFGTTIKELFTKVVDKIKEIFGINSPATTMKVYGQYIFEGIVEGFKNAFSKLGDEIKALPGKIKSWFEEHFKNFSISDTLSDVIGTIGNANAISVGVELAKDGWNTVTSWINEAKQKGEDEIQGLVGLAKSGWTKLNAWISNNAVEKKVEGLVGLAKSGWTKLNAWISNNAIEKKTEGLVGLAKSGWTKLNAWISNNAIEKKVDGFVGLAKSGWTRLSAWVSQNAIEKKVYSLVGLTKSGWTKLSTWVGTGAKVWAYVNLWKDNWKSIVGFVFDAPNKVASAVAQTVWVGIKLWKDGWSSIKSFFGLSGGGIVGANGGLSLFAGGGAITNMSSKSWANIPQFAKGSLNAPKHGSMFVAGENGPEIMGHINGRTEILNRSQIAQTMNNAIVKGMVQFRNMQFNPSIATPYSSYAYSSDYSDNNYRNNDMAIAEQNKLLAEQNELLRQILEKPTGISSRDVFSATQKEANNYYNRTGNSPFLY